MKQLKEFRIVHKTIHLKIKKAIFRLESVTFWLKSEDKKRILTTQTEIAALINKNFHLNSLRVKLMMENKLLKKQCQQAKGRELQSVSTICK